MVLKMVDASAGEPIEIASVNLRGRTDAPKIILFWGRTWVLHSCDWEKREAMYVFEREFLDLGRTSEYPR
jgi:hypothetical protein